MSAKRIRLFVTECFVLFSLCHHPVCFLLHGIHLEIVAASLKIPRESQDVRREIANRLVPALCRLSFSPVKTELIKSLRFSLKNQLPTTERHSAAR